MQHKTQDPTSSLNNGTTAPLNEPLIEAYFELNRLKQLYRQGWLQRGIAPARCESVAEHSFGVTVLALFLADAHFAHLDRDKLLQMALLHDFGEIYAGDLTPADGVSREEKHRREAESVTRVLTKLPNGPAYLAIWDEFERGESAEAQLVRQLDRLEMALQAAVYEGQEAVGLDEFFETADQAIEWPALRDILGRVLALRK